MEKVVGVKFFNSKRIYYFSVNNLLLKTGMDVIVETERGLQFGEVVTDILNMEDTKVVLPLKNVLRIATNDDKNINDKNIKNSEKALVEAKKIASQLNLKMNFIDAAYTFDKNQLVFNFFADERIDFRELAKKLATIYKTRIELRQIGVRDKAKEIGGLGPCGRFLCCNLFLNDFNSVSINMAKNQYISLNPTKINGICGRLLCCLKYEDEQYTELKKELPPIGTIIKNKNISGKVVSHNIFKRTYVIEKADKSLVEIGNDDNGSIK